jgi:Nif-specific regulatory protein
VPLSTIPVAHPAELGAAAASPGVDEPMAPPSGHAGISGNGKMTDRDRVIAAMEKSGWVQAKAARLLGLTPRQIGYALKKYGIEVKQF